MSGRMHPREFKAHRVGYLLKRTNMNYASSFAGTWTDWASLSVGSERPLAATDTHKMLIRVGPPKLIT